MSILIILYIKFAQEVLISSCPIILDRYFRWGGGRAGIFLASLALTILPVDFFCGHVARKYEERTVVKVFTLFGSFCRFDHEVRANSLINHRRFLTLACSSFFCLQRSLVILGIGLFVMINFGSILTLAYQISDLFAETEKQRDRKYDWLLGIVQYFVGFTVTFLGLTAIDGATLSLLSKVSPPRIRSSSVALQLGTIVSFVSLAAKVLANLQILVIGLSHRVINTDMVNSLVIPLLIVCIIVAHFVRKHFFFLM